MVGKQISHYRILELISEGGMGAVYRGEDLTLGRTVAIKVVRTTSRDSEAASRRFLREAQAASRIDHPNVITVFEVLQEDGINYLVMQYLEGESLRAILNQRLADEYGADGYAPDAASATRLAKTFLGK